MQPLYLFIQGMRPLKAPTASASSAADPTVIAGDSEADRALVRRAIAYALYGQASSRVRADRELRDEESSCLRVTLVFWTHGNAWEVTRTMARLSNGGVGNTSCTLRRIGDVGPTVTRIDGARRVNRRLGELLQQDIDDVQPWLRPRERRPPPRRIANDGDAHDDVAATGVDIDLLRECMETVSRESAILRREAAALAEATAAVGALAAAQRRRAEAVLVERAEALRETKARHVAAIERLRALRTRYGLDGVGCLDGAARVQADRIATDEVVAVRGGEGKAPRG